MDLHEWDRTTLKGPTKRIEKLKKELEQLKKEAMSTEPFRAGGNLLGAAWPGKLVIAW
jgi:hypothetical protein